MRSTSNVVAEHLLESSLTAHVLHILVLLCQLHPTRPWTAPQVLCYFQAKVYLCLVYKALKLNRKITRLLECKQLASSEPSPLNQSSLFDTLDLRMSTVLILPYYFPSYIGPGIALSHRLSRTEATGSTGVVDGFSITLSITYSLPCYGAHLHSLSSYLPCPRSSPPWFT
jgi:hypothetical protein